MSKAEGLLKVLVKKHLHLHQYIVAMGRAIMMVNLFKQSSTEAHISG